MAHFCLMAMRIYLHELGRIVGILQGDALGGSLYDELAMEAGKGDLDPHSSEL
jgi:hypothetical protein